MMNKNNMQLRDSIAVAVLPVLLVKCEYLDYNQIFDITYEIADKMLVARNKDVSMVTEIKVTSNE